MPRKELKVTISKANKGKSFLVVKEDDGLDTFLYENPDTGRFQFLHYNFLVSKMYYPSLAEARKALSMYAVEDDYELIQDFAFSDSNIALDEGYVLVPKAPELTIIDPPNLLSKSEMDEVLNG